MRRSAFPPSFAPALEHALLFALVLADLSWICMDAGACGPALFATVLLSALAALEAAPRAASAPDELALALATALWCVGNACWTIADFGEASDDTLTAWGRAVPSSSSSAHPPHEATLIGIRFERTRRYWALAPVLFALALVPALLACRRFKAAAAAEGTNDADDAAPNDSDAAPFAAAYESAGVLRRADDEAAVPLVVGALSASANASEDTSAAAFDRPSTDPGGRLRAASADPAAHALWIAKDLAWWCAVEIEGPVAVAFVPIALVCAAALLAHLAALVREAQASSSSSILGGSGPPNDDADETRTRARGDASSAAGTVVDDGARSSEPEPMPDARRRVRDTSSPSLLKRFSWRDDLEATIRVGLALWALSMTCWMTSEMFQSAEASDRGARLAVVGGGAVAGGAVNLRWVAGWVMVAACVAYARHWIARGADAVARRRRM